MKRLLLTGTIAMLLTAIAGARTFTSADGSKTFEGDLRSFNKEAGELTVMMPNGKILTFSLDKLSEEDKKWIEQQPDKPAGGTQGGASSLAEGDVKEQLQAQKIGKNLIRGLRKMKGKSMRRYEMTKVPEYYILYFSAAW